MKYNTVLFDFGDTLTYPHDSKHWELYAWVPEMVKKLYNGCYRLGIISNTHRYQDSYWVRNKLAEANILQYFEMIITSANYAIHKPDMKIFQKAIDFMQLDPNKCVMVGDSEHADGACRFFNMTYLRVDPKTSWLDKLYTLLNDNFPINRKLSNISEYNIQNNKVITKLRHLSEVISVGDLVVVGGTQCQITEISKNYTRDDIFSKDEFIEFEIVKN